MIITYAQKPVVIVHADVFSKARGLNFSLSFHLHSYFVYASREGSNKSESLLPADMISIEISCTGTYVSRTMLE